MKIDLSKVLKSGNDDSFLFNDKQRAIKNHKLMQWAKVATFGLYMVAVFMLYVSDVWGIGSFIEKNSNEYVALVIFSIIAFVLAYFLASSKEAVYEDIAVHRSEGWKLKPSQYAAMGLFLSSGILFEMFSTTNNQQHIANTAAEQSSMMKSIQTTDVSILGSSGLTSDYANAQMKLAQCEQRMRQGKEKHCEGSKARVNAVKESMAMSNQLATTAAKQSMDNKVDGMMKIREHFDKPMFQAIGKAMGTDNNSGMLIVVGVLIFIFELQHIMALFAYANALLRLNRKGGKAETSPAPLGNEPMGNSSAPVSGFNSLADSAKQTVGEYAAKVEEGLKSAPEAIATEMMKAQYAREKMDSATANMLGNVGAKLDAALLKTTARPRKYPQEILFPADECKTEYDYQIINRVDKTPTPLPKMPVVETIQRIYADVKASGATSQEAIHAAVFDAYARIPSPAELDDADLEKVAGKITAHIIPSNVRAHSNDVREGNVRDVRGAENITVHSPSNVRAHSDDVRDDTHIPANVRAHSLDHEKALLDAMKDAQGKVDADILKDGYGLYEQWKAAALAGESVLSARGGRAFVNANLCQGKKRTITPDGMDALITIWQARATKEGVLTLNPKYTGKPPFPKYLLAA
jgi:hypothetical protein